jgi:hypothetical protein
MPTIAIVGGYGHTGTVVARQLLEHTSARIVLAGRDSARTSRMAREMGDRVTPRVVDVEDEASVAALCADADVVVNCVAPCSTSAPRVALSCAQHGRHYVDPGLYAVLEEPLAPYEDELRRRAVSFVSSAGEFPGLTELVPLYVESQARERFDAIDSVELYAADRNEWSAAAVRDIVWSIGHSDEPGRFKDGRWRATNSVTSLRSFRFPSPVGRTLVVPHFKPELSAFASDRGYGAVAAYVGGYSLRTLLVLARARTRLWRRDEHAALKVGQALRRDARRRGHGVAIVGVVRGRSRGARRSLVGTVAERDSVGYRYTGVMTATATRMVLEGRMRHGHRPLCDAADAGRVLAQAGVEVALSEDGGSG